MKRSLYELILFFRKQFKKNKNKKILQGVISFTFSFFIQNSLIYTMN